MQNSVQREPTATASPERALVDEQITIRADGLDPDEHVTLRVEMTWNDTTFSASATFEANDDGVVSTADEAPISGPYEGVQPMGLFWALRPTGDSPPERVSVPEQLPTEIRLERNDETLARTEITRRTRAEGVERRDVDADGVPAELYLPAGEGPHPGVVLLGGSEGGRPKGVRPWLLASHGYAVLGAAYFGTEGAPADYLVEVPVEAVERAVDWFAAHDSVRSEPLGMIGTSVGSELAFLLASRIEAVNTVVGIVPSGVVFQGLGENYQPEDTAMWAVDGEPVPYVPMESSLRDSLSIIWRSLRGKPIRMREYYLDGIDATDPERVSAAELPVEETDSRVVLLAGEDDALWGSATLARRLRDRLVEMGYEHDVDCRTYPDTGHAIGVPYLPTTHRSTAGDGRFKIAFGGSPSGYAEADESSWDVILETLEAELKLPDSR